MTNKEIANSLNLISKLMDIHGENSFKTKAYSNAAFKLGKIEPLKDQNLSELKIPGIGDSLMATIKELITTDTSTILEEYLKITPAGVVDMLNIKGLGPKKIALLWKEMNIESIGELAYACQENRLIGLKGFGLKTQETIAENIKFLNAQNGYYLYADLILLAEDIENQIKEAFPDHQISLTGDLRRQEITANIIEWVTTISQAALVSYFEKKDDFTITENGAFIQITHPQFSVLKFYCCEPEAFHKMLFSTTNTEEFQTEFLKEYSIPEQLKNETDIFLENKLHFIPPALRNKGNIIKNFDQNIHQTSLEIIQPKDIKGIIHAHSTYSDGLNSLSEMAIAAKEKGYEYLVISDHSQAASYAGGLFPDAIVQQHDEINELNKQLAPFKIFKSIEADILSNGDLDYTPEILATMDLVIASVHSNLKMTEEKAMSRLLAAIQNPFTRILGHPTGRLLLSRPGYPIDHKTIIDACYDHQVVIEINAHPRRLDLDWEWIRYAIEKGVLLSINPDAHSVSGMDYLKFGVLAAQKGGLTKENNLSSFSLMEMEDFISKKKH